MPRIQVALFNNIYLEKNQKINTQHIFVFLKGDPISSRRTVTASVGDSIVLEVTTTRSDVVLWNKDGSNVTDWNNQKQIVIDPVRVEDAGIYECYFQGERNLGKHAIMRVIVRGKGHYAIMRVIVRGKGHYTCQK